MGLKTSSRFPFVRGGVTAIVPTTTFSGKAGEDPSLSVNPYTGFGPGAGGIGLSAVDIESGNLAGAQLVEPDQISGWIDVADINTYDPGVSTTLLNNKQTVGIGAVYPNEFDLTIAGATFVGSAGSGSSNTYMQFNSPGSLQGPTPATTLFKNCGIDGTLDFGLYLTNSGQTFQHVFDSKLNDLGSSSGITIGWFPETGLLRFAITKKTISSTVTKSYVIAPPLNTPFVLSVVGYFSLAGGSAGWPENLIGDDPANTNGSEFPVMVYINGARQTLADAGTQTLFTDHMSITAQAVNTTASRFTLGARANSSGAPIQQLDGGSRIYFWRYYYTEILTEAGVETNYQASRSRLGI